MYVLRLADMIADREELDLQVQVCTSFEQEERLEEFQEDSLREEADKQSCQKICADKSGRSRGGGRGGPGL